MTPLEADVIAAAEQYEEAWSAVYTFGDAIAAIDARSNAHIALIAAVRALTKGRAE